MITAAHLIAFADDADVARAFFRDVLGFSSVDAGDGWLIFALPPSELAVHPGEFTTPITDEDWGRIAMLLVPGHGEVGVYEPTHPSPLEGVGP